MNIGSQGEKKARTYLEQHGLIFKASNVRYRFGELDLIMRDDQYWVFVEVKFRSNARFGGAISAVSTKQMARIRLAADHYLQQQKIDAPCRFDVIAIDNDEIQWLKAAF
ncbi:YraN family protein [Parashewanella spongiae]|uniref:UPF0102 protein D5R81_11750 n=1 Tax=Parashewanella spongiae TaxID=342950 RepID=A0A3A6TPP1_9GAMM|nr:YraN family protein [Parashewanella spongiae]MCL1078603.1 YraN family protein [Parashewanella spongiae]RJY13097.1 YraN family protein [Parashewanella spongiae]